jgi:hypothetical protein
VKRSSKVLETPRNAIKPRRFEGSPNLPNFLSYREARAFEWGLFGGSSGAFGGRARHGPSLNRGLLGGKHPTKRGTCDGRHRNIAPPARSHARGLVFASSPKLAPNSRAKNQLAEAENDGHAPNSTTHPPPPAPTPRRLRSKTGLFGEPCCGRARVRDNERPRRPRCFEVFAPVEHLPDTADNGHGRSPGHPVKKAYTF